MSDQQLPAWVTPASAAFALAGLILAVIKHQPSVIVLCAVLFGWSLVLCCQVWHERP